MNEYNFVAFVNFDIGCCYFCFDLFQFEMYLIFIFISVSVSDVAVFCFLLLLFFRLFVQKIKDLRSHSQFVVFTNFQG